MRQTSLPFPRICAAIVPKHFSLSFSHILAKISFVTVSIRPEILSRSIFTIIAKVAIILIAILAHPYSFSFSYSIYKFAFVGGSSSPKIFTFSVGLTMNIVSFVNVSIGKVLNAVTVFNKVCELTSIKKMSTLIMTFFSSIDSIAMSFVILPASNIFLMFVISPEPISLHGPILEIPNIVLIRKLHHTLTMWLIIGKIANINRVISKFHIPLTHFVPQTELTLVSGTFCDQDPPTMVEP